MTVTEADPAGPLPPPPPPPAPPEYPPNQSMDQNKADFNAALAKLQENGDFNKLYNACNAQGINYIVASTSTERDRAFILGLNPKRNLKTSPRNDQHLPERPGVPNSPGNRFRRTTRGSSRR